MNIIGQSLDLQKISEEYFKRLNPIKKDKDRTEKIEVMYDDETIVYQKANSLIGKFEFKLNGIKENPSNLNPRFIKLLETIFDKPNKHKFLKKIICGKPDELENYIRLFEKIKGHYKIEDGTKEKDIIKSIFDYDSLALEQNTWLGKKLGIKACPYCNFQYTSTLEDSAKFQLDHFYPKSEYPYLALSFYNLIPSCANCNLKKSGKNTYKDDFIHPYTKSFHQIAKFETDSKIVEDFLNTGKFNLKDIRNIEDSNNANEEFSIKLKLKNSNNQNMKAVKNHNDIFELEKKANVHKDVVSELYMKAYIYSASRKTELTNSFRLIIDTGWKNESLSLFTEDEINQIVFGNYLKEEDFHKRPLSKLTHDIAEELGLL